MTDEAVAQAVVALCRNELADPEAWVEPGGHRDSLALCVVNSIQSMGVRFGSVSTVVKRYRDKRPGMADTDGVAELLATFDECNGIDGWAGEIGNKHRTSTRAGAPLKAQAVRQAAAWLQEAGVRSTSDLRALDADQLDRVKAGWRAVPGQRSGISWRYFLMLAGMPGVKPDRMICRFVAAAAGQPVRSISPRVAEQAVEGAAVLLAVPANVLDHNIWRSESRRTGRHRVPATAARGPLPSLTPV